MKNHLSAKILSMCLIGMMLLASTGFADQYDIGTNIGAPPLDPAVYPIWKESIVKQNQNDPAPYSTSIIGYPATNIMDYTDGLISNEYIEFVVQNGGDNNGRFTVGTTGGNPDNPDDNNKKMLYGHPSPRTSYTTIRLGGVDYIYNPDTQYPTVNPADFSNVSEDTIQNVSIKQVISIIESTSTQREDTIQIKYIVKNNDSIGHDLGLRIMMDTMLGSNDRAPFRIPEIGIVTKELELTGDYIPEYWQAFDSLDNPIVISQGTLLRNQGIKPDKIQFSNWYRVFNTPWDYTVDPSSDNGDSAVSIYWNTRTLYPGDTREYVTYYGLSELVQDLSPPLAVSITGASNIECTESGYSPDPFTVTAYIMNNGTGDANNVKAEIVLPEGLELVAGQQEEYSLGTLYPNAEEKQVSWQIKIEPSEIERNLTYLVIFRADNAESKTLSRNIVIPAFKRPAISEAKITSAGTNGTPAGEPIDTGTGAHVLQRTLLSVNGVQTLSFTVLYNSLLLKEGPLGKGWGHNFETWLEPLPEGDIAIHWSTNRFNYFYNDGSDQFSSPSLATRFDTLVKNVDGSYTLRRQDQSVYQFNTLGQLVEWKNKYGQPLSMSYDTNGRLLAIIEPISGQTLTLHYNPDGLISAVSDNLNRQVTFAYDAGHNLVSITDALGNSTTYTYNADGRVLTATDAEGVRIFSDTYDDLGRVVAQDDAREGNQLTMFSYDESSQPGKVITTVTDRCGQSRIFTHDSNYQLLSLQDELGYATTYTYDDAGNRTSSTDEGGNITTFTYDERGNLLTITDPAGHVTTMAYDERNNLLSIVNAVGKETIYTYDVNNNLRSITDSMGNTTTYTYDANGLLLSETTPKSGVTAYTYQNGLLHTVTNPIGNITTYSYDAAGRMVSITNAMGKTTIMVYDAMDNLISITDPLGNTTSYTYDSHSDKLTEIDPKGNITQFTYDGNGNLINQIDALSNETRYKYDPEDRLIRKIDARGNITTLAYDAKGRLIEATDPLGYTNTIHYDAMGNVVGQTDALRNRILTISYDALHNPLIVKDALGHTTTNQYDALSRLVQVTDPLGRITQFHHDDLNRLTSVIDPLGGQARQGFDANGNRTSLIDPGDNQTKFSFDLAERLTAQTSAAGSHITFDYNDLGLLAEVTNGRGQVTTYQYDDASRLFSFTEEAGTVAYTYDKNGNVLTVTDAIGTIIREYDALDRVVKYTDVLGNTIHYTYDQVGNLTTITYPDGRKVHYGYDASDQLISVTDWAGRITTYVYDANGRMIRTTRPNGTVLAQSYDAAGQLIQQKDVDQNGDIISHYEYTYDAVGEITAEQSGIASQPFYIEDVIMTYTSDNRLATYNGQMVEYDGEGNMIKGPLVGGMAEFTYDARNRLTEVGDITYFYDAENNRIGVIEGGQQTSYVINPQATLSQVLIRTDADNKQTFYIYGLGLIGQEDAVGGYRAYHFDFRGSTVALTVESGKVTDRFQYGPYGESVYRSGSINTPFLFNGQYGVMTDSNGMYYMRARYYNKEVRRFVNQDVLLGSIDDGQSLNYYAYANGNPVSYVDPFGLCSRERERSFSIEEWEKRIESDELLKKYAHPDFEATLSMMMPIGKGLSWAGSKLPVIVRWGGKAWEGIKQWVGSKIGPIVRRLLTNEGGYIRLWGSGTNAWIKRDLFNQLQKLAGKADFEKFKDALKKGIVGPISQSGIKALNSPVGKYTHELKIGGSANRLL